MSEYKVTVVEYPAKRLVGMKVRTSMHKAQQDCPALWQTFGPRIGELSPADCGYPGSYGVSVMLNAEDFDYWATVEMPSAAVPAGMDCIDIPAGQYATCTVPNLEKLGDAYMYLYGEWPKSQTGCTFNGQAPCFELYPPNWQCQDSFEIFMPLKSC